MKIKKAMNRPPPHGPSPNQFIFCPGKKQSPVTEQVLITQEMALSEDNAKSEGMVLDQALPPHAPFTGRDPSGIELVLFRQSAST